MRKYLINYKPYYIHFNTDLQIFHLTNSIYVYYLSCTLVIYIRRNI